MRELSLPGEVEQQEERPVDRDGADRLLRGRDAVVNQVMETGRERLSSKLKFPLIVKPNQEGSSKGVSAQASGSVRPPAISSCWPRSG